MSIIRKQVVYWGYLINNSTEEQLDLYDIEIPDFKWDSETDMNGKLVFGSKLSEIIEGEETYAKDFFNYTYISIVNKDLRDEFRKVFGEPKLIHTILFK